MRHKITRNLCTLAFCVSTAMYLSACSDAGEPETATDPAAGLSTAGLSTMEPSASVSSPTSRSDCSLLPPGLVDEVGAAYQLVRNLALAGGKNLAMMEKNGNTPKPASFRSFASAFEQLDVSGVEALPNFDKPDVAATGIRELADKLEAALAQKDNLNDPAWAALAEFSKRRLNRQQASINYYLSESGCK